MTKNHTKTLAFTTLDISQRKKLMIVKIFTVWILCIYLIDHASEYIEEKGVNPLYLNIDHASGYIKEKGVNKETKELLKKYVFNVFKESESECDYEKDYMKIKFNSDDNLQLNKPLKFHNITITIRFVFEEEGKLYPQVFLNNTLYELRI